MDVPECHQTLLSAGINVNFIPSSSSDEEDKPGCLIHLFLLAEKCFLWAGELGSGEGKSGGGVKPTGESWLLRHISTQFQSRFPSLVPLVFQGRSLG